MRTETINLYSFKELSPEAQQRALDNWREHAGEDLDYSCIYDDAATIAGLMGIDINLRRVKGIDGSTRYAPAIYWSGFWSQGDGACFEGNWSAAGVQAGKVQEHAPHDTELHRIAAEFERIAAAYPGASFQVRHNGYYHHEGCTSFDMDAGEMPDNAGLSYESDEYDAALKAYQDVFPEDELKEAARDLMRWLYSQLEKEYEYQTSEEVGREMLSGAGEVFTEEGGME